MLPVSKIQPYITVHHQPKWQEKLALAMKLLNSPNLQNEAERDTVIPLRDQKLHNEQYEKYYNF